MNPENVKNTIQAVVDGLTPLAQKLQIPIEGLFGWALRHNYAEAGVGILKGLLMIPTIILYIKFIKWGLSKEDEDSIFSRFENDFGKIILGFFISCFVIFIIISGIIGAEDAVSRLIAPEWNTSKDIIQLIKGNNF